MTHFESKQKYEQTLKIGMNDPLLIFYFLTTNYNEK